MFSAFFGQRIPTVFGDPMSEPDAFSFAASKTEKPAPSVIPTAPAPVADRRPIHVDPTQDQRGQIVGRRDGKLLVKLEATGQVISVDPTDIVRVL
jgi:hypothetical protein